MCVALGTIVPVVAPKLEWNSRQSFPNDIHQDRDLMFQAGAHMLQKVHGAVVVVVVCATLDNHHRENIVVLNNVLLDWHRNQPMGCPFDMVQNLQSHEIPLIESVPPAVGPQGIECHCYHWNTFRDTYRVIHRVAHNLSSKDVVEIFFRSVPNMG